MNTWFSIHFNKHKHFVFYIPTNLNFVNKYHITKCLVNICKHSRSTIEISIAKHLFIITIHTYGFQSLSPIP